MAEKLDPARGRLEWTDGDHVLTVDAERLTARHEGRRLRTAGHEHVERLRRAIDHVLAVVDDEQHRPALEHAGETVEQVPRGHTPDGGSNGAEHVGRVGQARKRDEADASKALSEPGGDMDGQPRLAHPADTGQGHDGLLLEQHGDRRAVVGPPHQWCAMRRQPGDVGRRGERRRGRQVGVDDLPHPFGLDQVAQPVDAGVGQLDGTVARGRSQQGSGHVGHHDLPTSSEPHDPRRSVHRPTAVVVTGPLDLARVHGHAHADPELSELALGDETGAHRRIGRAEGRRHTVAHGGEDPPAGVTDARPQGVEVPLDQVEHLGRLLPTPGGALDVGEEQRHRRCPRDRRRPLAWARRRAGTDLRPALPHDVAPLEFVVRL